MAAFQRLDPKAVFPVTTNCGHCSSSEKGYVLFMFKLGYSDDGVWRQYSHPAMFCADQTANGAPKVVATAPGSDPIAFRQLAKRLSSPLPLLYVLHTPRGEGKAGRYQSGDLDHAAIPRFLDSFDKLLRTDSRFDLWVHSPADRATIVWDRHDLLHIYGMMDSATETLRALGFESGNPAINFAHEHHYHPENDQLAAQLLSSLGWHWVPLRPEDEQ